MRRDIFFFQRTFSHGRAARSTKRLSRDERLLTSAHPYNFVRPGETEQCDRCKRRVNLLLGTFFNGREFSCIKCRASELLVPLADIAGLTQVQFTEWLHERKKH